MHNAFENLLSMHEPIMIVNIVCTEQADHGLVAEAGVDHLQCLLVDQKQPTVQTGEVVRTFQPLLLHAM